MLCSMNPYKKHAFDLLRGLALLAMLFSPASLSWTAYAETVISRTAEIAGVKLHYLSAGHGAPLILLHGYAETRGCGERSCLCWVSDLR